MFGSAIGKIRERDFKDKAQKAAGKLLTEHATICEKYWLLVWNCALTGGAHEASHNYIFFKAIIIFVAGNGPHPLL